MDSDADPDPNAFAPQIVTMRLRDGTVLNHAIDTMLASPARPLPRVDQLSKFRRCWALSAEPLSPPDPVIAMIARLEELSDLRELLVP